MDRSAIPLARRESRRRYWQTREEDYATAYASQYTVSEDQIQEKFAEMVDVSGKQLRTPEWPVGENVC